MAENWPYAPALLFLGASSPALLGSTRALGVVFLQFSVCRLLLPRVGALRQDSFQTTFRRITQQYDGYHIEYYEPVKIMYRVGNDSVV